LTFSVHTCSNPNIFGEFFENLSVHKTGIFRNFHLASSPIIGGPGALAMRWLMVINNHLSMHYPDSFLRGPTNSWWLMGFKRCNGDQKKVNLNRHAEGVKMELTLARSWVQKHHLYELVSNDTFNHLICSNQPFRLHLFRQMLRKRSVT
jgi:hypothetical protein